MLFSPMEAVHPEVKVPELAKSLWGAFLIFTFDVHSKDKSALKFRVLTPNFGATKMFF